MKHTYNQVRKIWKNENGMALAVVLMVVVVFSLLGIALIGVAAGNTKLATITRTNQATYYIAEAGVTHKLSEIQSYVDQTRNDSSIVGDTAHFQSNEQIYFDHINQLIVGSPHVYNSFDVLNGSQPEADVSVNYTLPATCNVQSDLGVCNPQLNLDNCAPYTIRSTGKIGGEQTTVAQDLKVCFNFSLPNTTVFSTSQNVPAIKLNGAREIVGTVGTNTGSGAVKVDGNNSEGAITGTIYYSGTASPSAPVVIDNHNTYVTQHTNQVIVYLPPYPTFPDLSLASTLSAGGIQINNLGELTLNSGSGTLDLTKDESLKSITVGQNQVLTIDTGTSDKSIRVSTLDLKGTLKLTGSGKLNLYVDSNMNIYDSTILNPNPGNHPDNLSIYYSGNSNHPLTLSGQICAGIYVEKANLSINDNANFYGPILDKDGTSISYNGTHTKAVLIEAPNADFEMNGGSKLVAKLIIKTYTSDGSNSQLTDPNREDYQQSPLFPNTDLIVSSPLRETN